MQVWQWFGICKGDMINFFATIIAVSNIHRAKLLSISCNVQKES